MEKRTFHGVDVDGILKIRNAKGLGVSAAVENGNDIETYCSGSGRFGMEFPVNPDMLFQAGSVSKPAFAATLLRYVDRGLIDLDADISGTISDFVDFPLTFSALLSHTAGFNLHGFNGYRAKHKPLSLEDVLSGRGNSPKVRRVLPYGERYSYSGGGITLAELAFTRLTGTSLREAFEKEIMQPLGLKLSGYFQPLDEDKTGNAAFGGRLGRREDKAHGYHYFPEHASAGLWTTPTELCRLGVALSRSYREGGLLTKKSAERMMTPVKDNYGLCIFRENTAADEAGHGGWNCGFLTGWSFSLSDDFCVSVMVNRADMPTSKKLSEVKSSLYRNAKE